MAKTSIKYIRLEDIAKWDRNPRTHDIKALTESMKRFGFINPIVLDEKSQRLVAGHGRAATLEKMRKSGEQPPEHVQVDKDGLWLVPVLSGVAFANDTEFEAFGVADNRLGEVGSYDQKLLAAILADLQDAEATQGIGFSQAEIDGLIAANQKIIDQATQELEEREDDTDDMLADLRGNEMRELVLHLDPTEYDVLTARLQRVMSSRRLPGYVEAVSALLDFWEAGNPKL